MKQNSGRASADGAHDESLIFNVVDNILICNISIDFGENYFGRLTNAVASKLEQEPYEGVILDMSGLPLLDHFAFPAISKLVSMIKLMGRCCVLSGISPGVAAFLAESDMEVERLETAGNTDKALRKIRSLLDREEQQNAVDAEENHDQGGIGASVQEVDSN